MSFLYIVATPIGNLEDITFRAIRILNEVDFILCEDTRVSKKLLDHYKIETPTISYHEHSTDKKIDYIINLLEEGKNLSLITDAGTPGISDPGGKLIQKVLEKTKENNVKIEAIPGPSAITAALSISGINISKFVFFGFPPHKNKRKKFIKKILESEFPAVVYESKHRIIKFLEEIRKDSKETNKTLNYLIVLRELSKKHETIYRGDIDDIINKIKNNPYSQKGEFVIILS